MKTVIFKSIVLIASIAIFCQCQTKQKGSHAKIVEVNGNEVIDCNISEVTDTIDIQLSEIIKKCEVIPLETNESSLFESVYHIGISDNYIAVHSRGQMPIKLFDRNGKFISNIGSVGRGPGEFNSLYGIQLDEIANRIYLTPFANAKGIITYNLQGENLDGIPLIYKQTKCWVYVEKDVVTVLSMPFNNEIPVAYQQTISGELIQKLPVFDHLILRPDFSSEVSSSRNDKGAYDIFVLPWGTESFDTLYHYNTKTNHLDPKYVSSFSDKKHGSWTYEWPNHYWSWIFGDKYKGAKVIVNKKTLKSDFFKLKNDFYGGIEMNKFFMSNNGMFISSISAIELITAFEKALKNDDLSSKERDKIESLKKSLHENDNEVLFVGEMF